MPQTFKQRAGNASSFMPFGLQQSHDVQRGGGILVAEGTQTLCQHINAYIAHNLIDILVPHLHPTVGHNLIKQALGIAHTALCRFGNAHQTGA